MEVEMKHQNRWYQFITVLLFLVLIGMLSSCGTVESTTATSPITNNPSSGSTGHIGHDDSHDYRHLIAKANVGDLLISSNTTALAKAPEGQGTVGFSPQLRPMFTGSPRVDMKLLIISAEGGVADPTLAGITFFAKEIGIPYDVMIAKNETLTEAKLINANGDGKYQGIITTEVGLLFNNGGTFSSAFDTTEWNLLWQYAREFNVRQIAMSGFPGTFPEDYGLRNLTQSGNDRNIRLTSQGAPIFGSLKSNATIPVTGAFTYEAGLCGAACPTISTTPIITDAATNNVLGAVTTTADSREVLSLTMNHNSFLRHTGLMAYDLINWVTEGIFIGERRMYFSLDVDDHYLSSAVWNPQTNSVFPVEGPGSFVYQISATDLYEARDGVLDLRSRFNVPNFNYNQVFNADKADPNASLSCANNASLSSATLCVKDFFPWISHTFTHAEMDFLDYSQARAEFELNINFAETRLPFDRQFLVTGKHSGLGWYRITDAPAGAQCVVDQVPGDPFCQYGLEASNVAMLQAAEDLGIKYLAANRGWNTHIAECDTCLITHPLNSNIKLVPRWPTNIFFNTTTPAENTSEFNYLYGPNGIVRDGNGNTFFSSNQTWSQILDFEADITMRHILSTSPYPHYVHQNNLREYSNGRSLAYDLSEAVFQEYSKYFSLPLISQDWAGMTETLENRTSFFKSGASGVINKVDNTVTITSTNGGTVYVTGTQFANTPTFNYGNKLVSEAQLNKGESITNGTGGPPAPGNILTNGGFESNLTAWTACNSGISTIVGTATEGSKALNIKPSGTAGACLFQQAAAVTGSTYTFSCQAKRDQATVWSSMSLSFNTSTYSQLSSTLKEITGSAFNPISVSLVAPANAAYVAVTLYSEDSATIDDCILTTDAVNPPPPPPGPTNSAPTIAAVAAQSSVQSTSVAVAVTAQDPDGDTLSYSAVGLPTGVSISSTTGIMSGKPEVAGSNTVTVTVSDGALSTQSSFTWVITPTVTPPPSGTNLLTNPDFESGLTGWDLSGCGSGTITTSTDASSGNQSMTLTNATACVGQGLTATPGSVYTLSCDVKNVSSAYGDMSIYADDTEIAIAEISGSSFNRVSISGVAPTNSNDIYVYFYHEDTGSIIIDNCLLTK